MTGDATVLRGALSDALDLATRWRNHAESAERYREEMFGRLTTSGSAELDYLHDEEERLTAALLSELALPAVPEATRAEVQRMNPKLRP